MKIEREVEKANFVDLDTGEVFEVNDMICMKVEEIETNDGDILNAVCLENGCMRGIAENTQVGVIVAVLKY